MNKWKMVGAATVFGLFVAGCTWHYASAGMGSPTSATASDLELVKQSEQSLRNLGYVDADSPALSADERKAVDIARKYIAGEPTAWLYKVQHGARGWNVEAFMHPYIDAQGQLLIAPPGAEFFNVYISDDLKNVKVVGGA